MTWLLAHLRWLAPVALVAALLAAAGLIRLSGYRAGFAAAANAYLEAARIKDREYRRREADAEAKVNALAAEHLADEARIAELEQRKEVKREDVLCDPDRPVFADRLLSEIDSVGRE